jgi:hypothetical protein
MILVGNMLDTGLSQVLLPTYAKNVVHDPRALGLLVGAVGRAPSPGRSPSAPSAGGWREFDQSTARDVRVESAE